MITPETIQLIDEVGRCIPLKRLEFDAEITEDVMFSRNDDLSDKILTIKILTIERATNFIGNHVHDHPHLRFYRPL